MSARTRERQIDPVEVSLHESVEVSLMDDCCRIADEIDFVSAATTTWSMHTMATVHINGADGSSASLSMGGVDLHATIVGE